MVEAGAGGLDAVKAEIELRGRNFTLAIPLGSEPPIVIGGGARFEELTRPEETSLTVFEGNDPIRLDVPVLLDGWPHGGRPLRSVRPEVERILKLCEGREGNRPPWFKVQGPIPYAGRKFVMAGTPTWGPTLRKESNGHFVWARQPLTLHLTQFEDPDTLRFRRRPRRQTGSPSISDNEPVSQHVDAAVPLWVHATEGDTLVKISAAVFGDPSKAKAIGKANGIRDVRRKLPAGTKIKIPVS